MIASTATPRAFNRLRKQLVAAIKSRSVGEATTVPEAGHALWRVFCDLSSGRTYGMSGPNPLTWQDISAWSMVRGIKLAPHHIDIISAMDETWLDCAYNRSTPRAPVTVSALDAAFDAAGW